MDNLNVENEAYNPNNNFRERVKNRIINKKFDNTDNCPKNLKKECVKYGDNKPRKRKKSYDSDIEDDKKKKDTPFKKKYIYPKY